LKPTKAGEKIGDEVLVQVLHAVLFGEGTPKMFGIPPPGGYTAHDVATAVTLVSAVHFCILY